MSFTIVEQAYPRVNRSELAVPGSSPQLFEKAASSAVDAVFLDLKLGSDDGLSLLPKLLEKNQPAPAIGPTSSNGFERPASVDACVRLLAERADAVVIAGGTDLDRKSVV